MTIEPTLIPVVTHTSLPWREEDGIIYGFEESVGDEVVICDMASDSGALTEYDVANAAFIVRACNAHAHLVDALCAAKDELKSLGGDTFAPTMLIRQIDAALAKAGVR